MAQDIGPDRLYVLRRYVAAAIDEGVGPGGLREEDRGARAGAVGDQVLV